MKLNLLIFVIFSQQCYSQANQNFQNFQLKDKNSQDLCNCIYLTNSKNYGLIDSTLSVIECTFKSNKNDKVIYQVIKEGSKERKEGQYLEIKNNKVTVRANYNVDTLKSATFYTDSSTMQFNYKNGLIDGPFAEYYSNFGNHLKVHGSYKKNAKAGKWLFITPSGKLKMSGNYSGDYLLIKLSKSNKELLFFDNYGKLLYKRPNTIKNLKYLASNYSLNIQNLKFPILVEFRDGEWKYYSDEGNYTHSVFYKNGKLIKMHVPLKINQLKK